ncbi:hypothetical protein QBC46DRAFT_373656 [Diplogelasinospora grovesii]|uniref:C2H2-type domain-containing protein n=1 Tax=Diplogelasinospora grovesii TaxID=303347 RepID=A0AAN6NFQ1_9PEZI|nr:hypothetical protein QBC46DRAFT_373656 [Diplogelasinospora grovesii]
MESKKMFASLMEDDSVGPSSMTVRPLSPFRTGRPAGCGGRESSYATTSQPGLDLGQTQPLSCVTRETSHEDCARHRFIVWAAVKRNSCSRMTAEEKLECPLLHCTKRFSDHEAMLKHLAGCSHLPSGEYWCYDHMRVERFDDMKCKRCLGHPSKRRKMLSMAKNFFHSLGHKSKKGHGLDFDIDDSLPPPSYDSLIRTAQPSNNHTATELSSNEIVEIDSREVSIKQHDAIFDGVINPQALLMSSGPVVSGPVVPELDSTALSDESFMQWQATSMIMTTPTPNPFSEDGEGRSPISRPSLQVNTCGLQGQGRRHAPRPVPRPAPVVSRSKGLSPSSSVRSNASTDSNISAASNGSSLISPASNWSGTWSMASDMGTNLTSPVDLVSPIGFLSDDPFADQISKYHDACPDFLHDFYSELPADLPLAKAPADMASDPLVLPFKAAQQTMLPYTANMMANEDTAPMIELDEPEVEESNVCCSETKSMIASAWDALQEHIVSSMVKIQSVRGNPLADQLRSMSTRTIATAGLRTLRALLNGGQPTSASDTLCFIHVVFAFSLVIHEQGASHRSKDLFLQTLSYANSLPPNDRDLYSQLAFHIWQPSDVTQADINQFFVKNPGVPLSRSSSLKGKAPEVTGGSGDCSMDSMLVAARNFLDELECSLVLGQIPSSPDIQGSELYTRHLRDASLPVAVNEAFRVTVEWIVMTLAQCFANAGDLVGELDGVKLGVNGGLISSIRRVEIELLHAGKGCMPAARFFDDFVPAVRRLCDPIYKEHDAGASRRDIYHSLGVSLIENMIPEFDSSSGEPPGPAPDEHDDLDEFINNLTATDLSNVTSAPFIGLNPAFDLTMDTSGLCGITNGLPIPTVTMTPPESSLSSAGPSFSSQTSSPQATEQRPQTAGAYAETAEQQQTGQKVEVEADSCCELCGYRPKGDPQWFKGSMAKHRKLQHSTAPPKIYKCPYPGCTSQYRNRPDNLRQHQIKENHWAPDEEGRQRRPSKRKKVAQDE